MNTKRYWLFKSEPDVYSINDLAKAPKTTTRWDGVRNYQARNFLRDQCQVGDDVLFYHSSCAVPGVAGIVRIVRSGYPDPTAFELGSPYLDPNSKLDAPRWYSVDVQWARQF